MKRKLTIALVAHDHRASPPVPVHNIPIACNRYSADLMITSNLWDDDDYTPSPPRYEKFDRESLNLRNQY